MSRVDLTPAWEKLRVGDPITDDELRQMIVQIEMALPYLQDRPGFELALTPTLLTLHQLQGFQAERKRRRKP